MRDASIICCLACLRGRRCVKVEAFPWDNQGEIRVSLSPGDGILYLLLAGMVVGERSDGQGWFDMDKLQLLPLLGFRERYEAGLEW